MCNPRMPTFQQKTATWREPAGLSGAENGENDSWDYNKHGGKSYWPGWRLPSCSPSCWRWRWLYASSLTGTCRTGTWATGRSGRPCTRRRWATAWSGPWSCWCSWWWPTGRCPPLEIRSQVLPSNQIKAA